jgi:hypothetical protein
MRQIRLVALLVFGACVPTGTAPPWDGGNKPVRQTFTQAPDVLTRVFEDSFDDRADAAAAFIAPLVSASAPMPSTSAPMPSASAPPMGLPPAPTLNTTTSVDTLGPNWRQSQTTAWRVENGKLCGKGARNHGVWLTKKIPINARIEFDAIASSEKGDLKAELWGDGQSAATSVSYTNATSYLAILGGWENTFHVLARINEHGKDRKEIKVDKDSDDPREHAVSVGQVYRFKIERNDGKTVRMFVNNVEYMSWADTEPLAGIGHDHFGFNNWEVKTCFDNVRITPL